MKLYIGNKNYSSWSMRPWVLLRHFDLPFEEILLPFDEGGPESPFKRAVRALSPAGRVPVLVDDGLTIWDSLAIAEYAAERFAPLPLWPRDRAARAEARSICAEMHSGFGALRTHCPMNIEAHLPDIGPRILAEQPAVAADLDRCVALWTSALARSGGPFLFGDFSIADAYYAPVAARTRTYGLPVPPAATAWIEHLWATPAVAAWVRDALAEGRFVPSDEPYRRAPTAMRPGPQGKA